MKYGKLWFIGLGILALIVGVVCIRLYQNNQEQLVGQVYQAGRFKPLSAAGVAALPDPNLTPGLTNPNVTQDNIKDNICNPNWTTKSIRPAVSYTNALKLAQIKQYGYQDTNPASYEEDHLIALTDGGNPTDPKNLWPQPYAYPGAHEKDKLEVLVHQKICAGDITLKQGQDMLSQNWYKSYQTFFGGKFGSGASVIDEDDN